MIHNGIIGVSTCTSSLFLCPLCTNIVYLSGYYNLYVTCFIFDHCGGRYLLLMAVLVWFIVQCLYFICFYCYLMRCDICVIWTLIFALTTNTYWISISVLLI